MKRASPCFCGTGVNRGQRSGVAGIEESEKIERFASVDFTENDLIGAMSEGRLRSRSRTASC